MGSKSNYATLDASGNSRNGAFVSGFIQYLCESLRRLPSVRDVCMYDSSEDPWM